MSFSIRVLLAPFLQQGNGDADSFPEEDQHEDDKHFKKAEYYHFKQEKKKISVWYKSIQKNKLSPQKLGLNFVIISANSDSP